MSSPTSSPSEGAPAQHTPGSAPSAAPDGPGASADSAAPTQRAQRNQTPLIIGMLAVIVALVLGLWQLFTSSPGGDPVAGEIPSAEVGTGTGGDGEPDGTAGDPDGTAGDPDGTAGDPDGSPGSDGTGAPDAVGTDEADGTQGGTSLEMPAPTGTYQPVAELAALKRGAPADPVALGDPDAPVTMLVYSDFSCPFCARFSLETLPELEKYVDAGHLRVEWRDFAVLGQESVDMAVAGQAAARQGKFWEYHDWLYENQPSRGAGTVTTQWLTDAAVDLGMDATQFQEDLADTDESIWNSLIVDGREALQFSQGSTPAFVINGVVVIGAHPTEYFEDVIAWAYENA